MNLRTPAALRSLFEDAARDNRDPFLALYDAGRLDRAGSLGTKPRAMPAEDRSEVNGRYRFTVRVHGYARKIASYRQVRVNDLQGRRKTPDVSSARHELAWILHNVEQLSCAEVSRIMHRDHATTTTSVAIVEAKIAATPELRAELLRVAGVAAAPAVLRSVA